MSWRRARTPWLYSTFAKVCYASSSAGALVSAVGPWLVSLPLMGLGLLAYPLLIVSYILSLTETTFHGGISVSPSEVLVHERGARGLTTNGGQVSSSQGARGTARAQRVIARAAIAGAMVVEREVFGAFVPTVEIELADGDTLAVRLRDPSQARALVASLGFGPGGKRVRARLAKPTRRLLHPLIGLCFYVVAFAVTRLFLTTDVGPDGFGHLVVASAPVLALAFYELAKRVMAAPEVTVGDDGVAVTSLLGRSFVPLRDVEAVSVSDLAPVLVTRRGGGRVGIGGLLLDRARKVAIARAIEERIGPAAASPERHAHYGRGDRPVAAWRDHLSRAASEAGYRATAATADEAMAVLRSAHATPDQRVGAALALRAAGAPPERIRVAAAAAADERVRVALHAVADAESPEDDATIEKAVLRLRA